MSHRTCDHKKRNNDCIEPNLFQKMYLQTVFYFHFSKLIRVHFWQFEKQDLSYKGTFFCKIDNKSNEFAPTQKYSDFIEKN